MVLFCVILRILSLLICAYMLNYIIYGKLWHKLLIHCNSVISACTHNIIILCSTITGCGCHTQLQYMMLCTPYIHVPTVCMYICIPLYSIYYTYMYIYTV